VVKCGWGGCQRDAEVSLTAAYPADAEYVHPLYATYPMPMHRACRHHVVALIEQDAANPGATPAFLIRKVNS
jgi:hypothetical protein